MKKSLCVLCLVLLVPVSGVAQQITANGLFYGKAVLTIDGKQVLMEVGQTRQGVKLIEADEDHAVVMVKGKKRFIYLDKTIAKEYSTPNEFERHDEAKSHVIKAHLIHQALNLATFQVEYFYREQELGAPVTLSAKTLFRGKDTESWAHSYTRLNPGRHTVAITISMNEQSVDSYLSDAVQFDLVSVKNGETKKSGTYVMKLVKEWTR